MTTETLRVVVRRREEQGQGVLVLELADPDGVPLPPFEAGAHVDLHLGDDLIRQYSLCNDPVDRSRYRLGILRDPASRGGSVAAHARLQEGTEVTIGLPRNHFPLAPGDGPVLLIGGGIGVTPMIAMAHALHVSGRPFELHYCGRSEAACAFIDELRQGPFARQVSFHFDDREEAQKLSPTALVNDAAPGTQLYICGPAGFMDWVIGAAEAAGMAADAIHKEYFQGQVAGGGEAFQVLAKRSGKEITVAAGQTIVEALATVGIKIQVSCEQGICGTCLCNVLEGVPDHRDVFLNEDERADNDQILLCCSRAKTPRLVLDL